MKKICVVKNYITSLFLCADKSGDRLSDESSKKADSDSHPENWTDHEASDPPPPTSSPPKQVSIGTPNFLFRLSFLFNLSKFDANHVCLV